MNIIKKFIKWQRWLVLHMAYVDTIVLYGEDNPTSNYIMDKLHKEGYSQKKIDYTIKIAKRNLERAQN